MALLHVNFFSDTLGMCMNMDVILPQKANGQIGVDSAAGDTFPTLYLLHGMSDDHTIWQRRTSIERYVSDMNLAVVMPSTHLGFYTDMAHGHRYFTYITKELPAICRSFFRGMSGKREDTFVAGLSMGGYGAFKMALGAPETFCAGASLSGALDVASMAYSYIYDEKPAYWNDIFGSQAEIKGSDNDLLALADRLKQSGRPLPKLYAWCGTEDFLYQYNLNARDRLNALGYELTYEESPGDHQWRYWDEKIQAVLKWLPIR